MGLDRASALYCFQSGIDMKPDFTHILTYLAVVEHGSFTKAATILKISKSVVSKHISALEEALSAQLMHRSTRKILLTEVGQHYYDHLKSIPDQLEQASHVIHNYQAEPMGILKVIAPANFEYALRGEVLHDFLTRYPQVKLHVEFEKHPEDFIDSDFDIIILWKFNLEELPAYNLVTKKLFTMPIGMYASPEYLKKHGTPKKPADLTKHNCFSVIDTKWPFKMKDDRIEYVHVSGNLLTESVQVIHAAAMQGLGIAYSYPFVFQQALKDKTAVKLLESYTQLFVDINAYYRQSAYRQKKVGAFIECVQGYYQRIHHEVMARGKVDKSSAKQSVNRNR
jgi:DNA-binding transcriptional LysR family regulator